MVDKPRRRAEGLAAAGLFGSALTGFVGLVVALAAAVDGDHGAAGFALLAAAVAFGLLANACLRD